MSSIWADRWNERYSNEAYAYGQEPNDFLKQELQKISPAKILFPAEGEGRNAIYAASLGWEVSAFDIAEEGRKKAIKLAADKGVSINYQVGDLSTLKYTAAQFDAIALIFAHFPTAIKSDLHKDLSNLLKPGGLVIFEAFSKSHIEFNSKNEKVGGPKELGMLFSIEEIKHDFPGYTVELLEEKVIELQEGIFHNGTGSVIRFVGRKK
jgi:2-polyprenyl-3-methyl-5-hydroxy-6-metoxy-1,4-benzoquinol methylase